MMRNSGQISAGIVWTVVILLVAVAFGGLIFGKIQDVAEKQTAGTGDTTTTATLNSALSDNTGNVPNNWENYTERDFVTNAWNTGGYLTVTCTDNAEGAEDNWENGIWYQSFTLAGVGDGITSATLSWRHRVIDNENAASIVIEVLLGDGTDNTRIFYDNVTADESASWTSGENNVMDNISATGTYTVWLRTEINPVHADEGNGADTSSIIVGWDEVSISVDTYGKGVAENIIADVGETGSDVFPLILLLVLIGVFVAIISILKVLG